MKKLILLFTLVVALGGASFAQTTVPVTGWYPVDSPGATAVRAPLLDSVRQVVHKLFKWGRLYSTVGAVSGGVMVASAISYIARRDDNWTTGVDLVLGANALAFGTVSMVRFSRKRERKVIADLEQGQPLPPDVAAWVHLVRNNRRKNK
ncbi:hypothetical protein GCM10027346_14700 [Hymenobacter seoulensis]